MTPLLISPLVITLACLVGTAQNRAQPEFMLEGTWLERTLPGEKSEGKLSLACTGNKITLTLQGQVLQGTFESEADSSMTSITITVTVINGRALAEKRVYLGQYSGEGDTIDFRLAPTAEPIAWKVRAFTETLPDLPPAPPRIKGTNDLESLRKEFQESEKRYREYQKRYQEYQKKRQEWEDRVSAELTRVRSPRLLGLAPVTFRLEKVKK